MQMIRWMCGVSMKDRKTNEESWLELSLSQLSLEVVVDVVCHDQVVVK